MLSLLWYSVASVMLFKFWILLICPFNFSWKVIHKNYYILHAAIKLIKDITGFPTSYENIIPFVLPWYFPGAFKFSLTQPTNFLNLIGYHLVILNLQIPWSLIYKKDNANETGIIHLVHRQNFLITFGSKYSRMNQVKFVEDSL